MKAKTINTTSPADDWWFMEKYGKNRYNWFLDCIHKKKGATNKSAQPYDPNLRSTKGNGGSTEMEHQGGDQGMPRKVNKKFKFDPPPFDMQNLFDFNYEDMINEKPNKRFDKVMNLVFNHKYYTVSQIMEQKEWINRYNKIKETGELQSIKNFYQKLSNYIIKNKLHSKENWVDGSVICNIAIIISEYVKTGELKTDYDFINNINKYNEDDDYRFHLWLILQCFTSKNKYYKKYIGINYIRDWWAICHLRHRHSDKDMKTKGHCCGFKDNNGKYIYKQY